MTRIVPAGPFLLSWARAAVLVSVCASLVACSKPGSADGDSADYVVPAAAYGDEVISFKQLSATEAAPASMAARARRTNLELALVIVATIRADRGAGRGAGHDTPRRGRHVPAG